jgi:hypothetical protein
MTAQDTPNIGERAIWTKAFHAAYIVAAVVASLGWTWLLGYFALALLGY